MTDRRLDLGAAGEALAARWLSERGVATEDRNIVVDGGEIDLLVRDGPARVAVEVRTITGAGDPIDAIDHAKRAHVSRLAAKVGATRVDFLGLGLRPWGIEVHWVPGGDA